MAAQSKPVSLSPLGKAAAGATGAVLANSLVYPLDMYDPQLPYLTAALVFPLILTLCRSS